MTTEKLIVEGMTCQHCVMALKKELQTAGVEVVNAGIGFADINIDDQKFTPDMLGKIVDEAGYKLVDIQGL